MPALDTNVLVRYIVQDDPSQLAAAKHLISRCVAEGSTLFIPVTVVLEMEWVLRSSFALSKDDVLMTLSSLISAAELTFESERALEVALQLFREGSADFADRLHVGLAMQAGEQPLRTFDEGAAKVSGAQLLAKAGTAVNPSRTDSATARRHVDCRDPSSHAARFTREGARSTSAMEDGLMLLEREARRHQTTQLAQAPGHVVDAATPPALEVILGSSGSGMPSLETWLARRPNSVSWSVNCGIDWPAFWRWRDRPPVIRTGQLQVSRRQLTAAEIVWLASTPPAPDPEPAPPPPAPVPIAEAPPPAAALPRQEPQVAPDVVVEPAPATRAAPRRPRPPSGSSPAATR
jgi:predicted nucleic-acid-binding protein